MHEEIREKEFMQPEIAPGVTLIDALSEVANIGAGNASARLERVLKEKVARNLYGNSVQITPQLIEYMHLANIDLHLPMNTHVAFYSLLDIGGSPSMLSVLFSMESALFISGVLEAKEKHFEILKEDDERILSDIASSILDSYIESTAAFLGIPIVHIPAKKAYLKPSSMQGFVKESIGDMADVALLFKTDFGIRKTSYKGDVKILLSLTELEPIMNAIRKNLGMNADENGKKGIKDIPKFHLHGGGSIESIDGLKRSLRTMNESAFLHHVTPFRNDFAAWIYDAFDEKNLALKMGSEKSRQGMIQMIDDFLRNGQISH